MSRCSERESTHPRYESVHRAPPASGRRARLVVWVSMTVIGRTLPGRETHANCLAEPSIGTTGHTHIGDVQRSSLHASSRCLDECRQGRSLPLSWIAGSLALPRPSWPMAFKVSTRFSARTKSLPRFRLVPRASSRPLPVRDTELPRGGYSSAASGYRGAASWSASRAVDSSAAVQSRSSIGTRRVARIGMGPCARGARASPGHPGPH